MIVKNQIRSVENILLSVFLTFLFMPIVHAETSEFVAPPYSHSTRGERHSFVAIADRPGMILFNATDEKRSKLEFLLIDVCGEPYVFLAPKLDLSGWANEIRFLTPSELKVLWPSGELSPSTNELSLNCFGWYGRPAAEWRKYQLVLRFEKDRCVSYKVSGFGIAKTHLLPTDPSPFAVRKSTDDPLTTVLTSPVEWCNVDGQKPLCHPTVGPDIIVGPPYKSGREARHAKPSPTLPESSPIPDDE